jgi:hypothetical protein
LGSLPGEHAANCGVRGITFVDRLGYPRKHPALSIEENSRLQFARLMRELDLDGEPLPDPRPSRGY